MWVPIMAVFCSMISCFPVTWLRYVYFMNDFEVVPVTPFITGITSVLTFCIHCVSVLRYLYFRIFSAFFPITIQSSKILTFIDIHVSFSLSQFMMSGLLLAMVLSFWTCWFHIMVTLPSWLVLLVLVHAYTNFHCIVVVVVSSSSFGTSRK